MNHSQSAVAVLLVIVFISANVLGFGLSQENSARPKLPQASAARQESASQPAKAAINDKSDLSGPVAIPGTSKPDTEVKKKKFPWLLVGGLAAAGIVAAVLLLKKKKTANPEAAGTGAIQVESAPTGANVYLNNNDTGFKTNATVRGLPAGQYVVKLIMAGYDDFEQSVLVEEGGTAAVSAALTVRVVREPEMVSLPGGTFMMGSASSEALNDESPIHQVTLSSFEIGKYEVTQEEWISVMGSNPSYFKGARLPVESVTWPAVKAFIERLNELTGKRYRLPSEAEWEYACRAGTAGDRYGDLDAIAWYSGNSGHITHEVGGKAPNAFGLYDMLGNVYEWCAECYAPYSAEPATNPRGYENCDETIANTHHIVRGGSWLQDAVCARAPFRNIHFHHYDLLGFRLVRD